MNKSTNIDQLHNAKVIDKNKMTKEQHAAINSLSDEEVKNLISINQKLVDTDPTAGVVF